MKLPAGHVAGKGVVKPTGYGGVGERLLREMGWERGQGLGKTGHGMKQAIEVKKKEDTVGIGGTQSYQWENKWWESAFDSAAKSLATSGSDSSDSSDAEDEDEAGPTEAAPAAEHNRDGTRTSASVEELKLQAALSIGGKLAAGRFGGRDGKMARIRAQEARAAAELATGMSGTTSDAAASGGDGKDPAVPRSDAEDAGKPPAKRARIIIEPGVAREAPQFAFQPTRVEGWWGARMFKSAGCLQGMEQDVKGAGKERPAFNEDEQARIYNAAQAGKTQGKICLGQSTGTLKVGGVKWTGSKVTFDAAAADSGELDSAGGGADAEKKTAKLAKRTAKLAAAGSCIHLAQLSGSDREAAAAAVAGDESAVPVPVPAAEPACSTGIKWKKLLSRALEGAAGQLKLKALHAEVATAVAAKGCSASGKEVRVAVAALLERSSRFVVDGKLVRLKGSR